jgi:hypothetical protein
MPAKAMRPDVLSRSDILEADDAEANGEALESSASSRAAEPPPPRSPARGTAPLRLEADALSA